MLLQIGFLQGKKNKGFLNTMIPFHSLKESWSNRVLSGFHTWKIAQSTGWVHLPYHVTPDWSGLNPGLNMQNGFWVQLPEGLFGPSKTVMVILVHVAPDKKPKTLGQLVLIFQAFLYFQDLNSWKFSAMCLVWMIDLLCGNLEPREHITLQLQFCNGLQLRATRLAACCLLRSEWLSGPLRQGLIIYLHALLSGPKGLFVFGGVCHISISFVAHCCLNSLLTFWCFNGIVTEKMMTGINSVTAWYYLELKKKNINVTMLIYQFIYLLYI